MVNEKIKILQLLIEKKDENLSIRQISKLRKINYKSAYNAVQTLNDESVVELIRVGNSFNVKFNWNFNQSVYLAESYRKEELLKNKDLKSIYQDLTKLNFSFIALVFGSYASNTQNKHSDIDMMVVGGKEEIIKRVLALFPFKIHFNWFSFEDFFRMLQTKEFSVVSEAVKNNIIIIGIEEYYRLIQNAG